MELTIDWENPIIKQSELLKIQPYDLNCFYCAASDFDKTNLFFMLLTSFHHYLKNEDKPRAAHLSFLIAYYLFVPLTPPGSCELAMYYIREAISLNPLDEYKEWLSLIEKGN